MTFKEARKGYTVYMLEKKDGMSVSAGQVTADVCAPHYPQTALLGAMQPTGMVVDVTISWDGKSGTFSIPEGSSVASAGTLTICADRASMLREVEAVKAACEEKLRGMPACEKTKADCERVLTEWNPALAEKKRQDERIMQIESKLDGFGQMLKGFIDEFRK